MNTKKILYVCVCALVFGICSVPYHEVARIVQTGFQAQAAASLLLDLGCPHALLNTNKKV